MTLRNEEKSAVFRQLPDVRRRKLLIGMTAAAAVGIVGMPAQQARAQGGQRLRVAAYANPSSLDPATGGSGGDHVFLFNLYDTLIDWEPETLVARPGLAREFKFTDPQTLILDLQEGVLFHDGTPMDAKAVKFNLDRNREAEVSNIRDDLASVKSVEVTGEFQVTLHLTQPDTALPLILSDRAGMMVSPTAIENGEGGRIDRTPVGTGPWKFVSWTDGERVVCEAFKEYWQDGIPGVPTIEMLVIPDSAAALRAVQSGQADLAYQLSERQQTIVERTPNLQLYSGPTLYMQTLWLNASRGPLADQRVRKALTMAMDRDAFLLATQAGVGEVARMNLPKAHWAYAPEAEQYTAYDPDKARALLAEAGFSDGLELMFRGYPDQASIQRQEVILSQLSQIGVRGRFTGAPIAESVSKFFGSEKSGDILLGGWTGRADPTQTYALIYSEDAYFNTGKVAPPEGFKEALLASRSTQDQAERTKALATVQTLVMDAALTIPLTVRYAVDAAANNVSNFEANLLGKPKLHRVTLG